MPTIFISGYKFRFYSSDVHEPPHVHVIHDETRRKSGSNRFNWNTIAAYSRPALNRVLKLTEQNQARLLEAWHEYFDR